jgi:hypothetical protein
VLYVPEISVCQIEVYLICNAIEWTPRTLSLKVGRLRREADHSPTYNAEIRNGGAIPPLLHISAWRDD